MYISKKNKFKKNVNCFKNVSNVSKKSFLHSGCGL